MNARYRPFVAILLAGTLGLIAPAHGAESTPAATVERFHAALVDVMKRGRSLDYAGRRDAFEPVLESVFDIPYIARSMLAQRWTSLSPQQQTKITAMFVRLAVANLAYNFDEYDGERFAIRSNRVLKNGRARLGGELIESDGNVIRFDYVLHETARGWQVTNVWFDGVSERSIRAAEFSSILAKEGFDALIQRLEKTIAGFAEGRSS